MSIKPKERISLYFDEDSLPLLHQTKQIATAQELPLSAYVRQLMHKDIEQQFTNAALPPVGFITADME